MESPESIKLQMHGIPNVDLDRSTPYSKIYSKLQKSPWETREAASSCYFDSSHMRKLLCRLPSLDNVDGEKKDETNDKRQRAEEVNKKTKQKNTPERLAPRKPDNTFRHKRHERERIQEKVRRGEYRARTRAQRSLQGKGKGSSICRQEWKGIVEGKTGLVQALY